MRRFSVVAAVAALVSTASSCRDPTEIRLDLTSDACDALGPDGITIATAADVGHVPSQGAGAVATACEDASVGSVGSIVLVPSGDRSAAVAVEIVAHLGNGACPGACIVARRVLRYVPHTRLNVPVALSRRCLGVPCSPDRTCVEGACVDAAQVDLGTVDDAGLDASSDALVAGEGSIDAGIDASIDTGAACAPVGVHASSPGKIDCMSGGPCADAAAACCLEQNTSISGYCASPPVPGACRAKACDEDADCATPGTRCCSGFDHVTSTFTFACLPAPCPATTVHVCKDVCACGPDERPCQSKLACGMATCGGICPQTL